MMFTSINQLIGSYYIRYDRLYELITYYYQGSNAEEIELYIDISPLARQLLNGLNTEKDSLVITSSVINMCAHYRSFFKTRFGVHARIYIVMSSMITPLNTKFVLGYSNRPATVYDNNTLDIFNKAVDLISLLCKYINDVYFIQTPHEAAVGIIECIDAVASQNPTIILTKDIYDYQLVNVPNTIILRPSKANNIDASYIIDGSNVIDAYIQKRKVKQIQHNVNSGLYSFVLSTTRLPERNVKALKSVPSVIKALNIAIDNKLIINGYNTDVGYLVKILNNDIDEKFRLDIDPSVVSCRFSAIDVFSQFNALIASKLMISNRELVNLYDPEALKEINDDYFSDGNNHLDLMGL